MFFFFLVRLNNYGMTRYGGFNNKIKWKSKVYLGSQNIGKNCKELFVTLLNLLFKCLLLCF